MCNTSMPFDGLSVTAIEPGMLIRFPYDGTGIHTVVSVSKGYGDRRVIVTDKGRYDARTYGTVRIVGVEGYNYHAGHGCIKDV